MKITVLHHIFIFFFKRKKDIESVFIFEMNFTFRNQNVVYSKRGSRVRKTMISIRLCRIDMILLDNMAGVSGKSIVPVIF